MAKLWERMTNYCRPRTNSGSVYFSSVLVWNHVTRVDNRPSAKMAGTATTQARIISLCVNVIPSELETVTDGRPPIPMCM